jgi:hypothetical protein
MLKNDLFVTIPPATSKIKKKSISRVIIMFDNYQGVRLPFEL